MRMDEHMKMERLCRSGNRAEIWLPFHPKRGTYEPFLVEWESDPSPEDLREYHEEVCPKQIVPVLIRRFEEQTGKPHRAILIAPGMYAYEPEGGHKVM